MKSAFYPLICLCGAAMQTLAAGQSCESSHAIQAAERKLSEQVQGLPYEQRSALQDTAYRRMITLDPRDFRPLRDYLSHVRYDLPEQWEAVREKTLADAISHPQDPVKLLGASVAFHGKDSP